MQSLNEIAAVAKKAAARAREVQLRGLREGTEIKTKASPQDLVTAADVESERVIAQTVAEAFPDHNLMGEEGGDRGRTSDWLWVVDPIDGTTNYSRHIPYFSCSIAVYHRGRPVVGLVANPMVDEVFHAVEGQGAFLNDSPIRTSSVTSFEQAVMICGFYYDRGRNIELTLDGIRAFYGRGIMGLRRFGSAALDLCYLAAGRADGYFEIGLNAWDFAAGAFIAQQAGAVVTDALGQPLQLKKSYVVAGAPALHPIMLSDLAPWRAAQEQSPW
jgi:myo-inositol-1(or 4)-monophosphatase